jgi:hypothetical protein
MPIRRILPAISLLLASFAVVPAYATTAVVPDSFPTIQAGIDSWRDTVLVRGGHYDEDLVLITGATLAVIPSEAGGDTVETGGLSLEYAGYGVPYLPVRSLADVRGFHFAGPVRTALGSGYRLEIAFAACRMDSGLSVPLSSTTSSVHIDSCTILNGVYVVTYSSVDFTNNTLLGGGVYVYAEGTFRMEGNHVEGPALIGIRAFTAGGATIVGNTVVATETGIKFRVYDGSRIADNEVRECTGSAFEGESYGGAFYERNKVARCGGYAFDILAGNNDNTRFRHNQVVDCAAGGVRAVGMAAFIADFNVVGRCGGPGFDIERGGNLSGNTSYLNHGAGFLVRDGIPTFTNNIAYGNLDVGLSCLGTDAPFLACNDWFANIGGATSGTLPGATDLAVDPLFCGPDQDDVHLSAGSPLLDAFGCGLIGALGQGCVDDPTPVLVSPASVEEGADGIKLTWLVGGSGSGAATVYRSPVSGEWARIGEVTADGTGYLRYTDHGAVKATRVGYRLGMVGAGIEGFYGETWVDLPAGEAPLPFALDAVRPNPSHGGALTVRFSLPTDAPARLELLDVAGRRVASSDVGMGQHTLDLGTGQHLAPGLYLVRLTQGANTRTTRVAMLR